MMVKCVKQIVLSWSLLDHVEKTSRFKIYKYMYIHVYTYICMSIYVYINCAVLGHIGSSRKNKQVKDMYMKSNIPSGYTY
jgi:hypothetical protein